MSKLLIRRFAPEPYSVQAARRVCLELIGRIEPSVRDRMGLLVSELVSDSVRRLSGRAGALIGIDIQRTDRGIRERVTDPDDRPDPEGLRPLRPARPQPDRGLRAGRRLGLRRRPGNRRLVRAVGG